MRNILQYAFAALVALLATSCRDGAKGDVSRRTVTVTIEPLRYFTERIAGDKFAVTTMVPHGGNPETYEPTAKQMMALSESDLYIKVGQIGFERTWMKRLEANAPHIIVVDSSEGVEMVKSENGIADPHVWMSTANATVMAKNIYKALANIDAKDSLYFKSNMQKLVEDIARVDSQIRSTLTKDSPRAFLIYHPILTYFARDYHLRQIPLEEEGREPSAQQLKDIISKAKRLNVSTFLVQREFANRNTEVVASSVGATKVDIDPLSYEWDKEMINVAKRLK